MKLVLGLLSWLLLCTAARAQEFRDNDYAIDLFTGPVLGAGRIVGMAGAYTSIATGIDGSMFNPAGYAERQESEVDWFEWEITGGISLGGLWRRNDVDNNGRNDLTSVDALGGTLGGRLQFGNAAGGLSGLARIFTLKEAGRAYADVVFGDVRLGTAYSFLGGGLIVGVNLRNVSLDVSDPGDGKSLVSFNGFGAEVGALFHPAYKRYRLGAAVRTPIDSRPATDVAVETVDGVRRVRGLVLPAHVHVPWELAAGFAYQFGERRSNTPWRNTSRLRRELKQQIETDTYRPPPRHGGPVYPELPEDQRSALRVAIENDREAERRYLKAQPRRYVLLSTDLLLFGRTEDGHGVNAFLKQRPERSGARVSYGMRVGVESEVWPNRFRMRGGSYLEPSRYQRSYYRPHGTVGFDVRLFDLWRWSIRASGTADVAPRYFDWGVSVGLWH